MRCLHESALRIFRGILRLGICALALQTCALQAQQVTQNRAPAPPKNLTPRQLEEDRADLLMARKQFPEAESAYLKLAESEPGNATLLNKLGIAYYQQDKLGPAKRYYERALKVKGDFASAMNNLGTVQYHRKKYASAVKCYKQAIAMQPDLAAVHSNLGYAYYHMRKYEEAMAAFMKALALDPQVFERRSSTGTVVQHRNVDDRAFFYFLMAKSYAKMGYAERCAVYLVKARDEGFKGFAEAIKDPVFATVLQDPAVRETLNLPPLTAGRPPQS